VRVIAILSSVAKAKVLEGIIRIIGLAEGNDTPETIAKAVRHVCTFRDIHLGSRVQVEEMMAAPEANKIQPVLYQRLLLLEDLQEALEY